MECLPQTALMDHLLGRLIDRESRMHLARCKKCQRRMNRMEAELRDESQELQGQASGFGLFVSQNATAEKKAEAK